MGKVKSDLKGLKDTADDAGGGMARSFAHAGEHAGGLRNQIGRLDNAMRGAHAMAMADMVRRYSNTRIVMSLLPIAATGAAFVVMGGLAVVAIKKILTEMHNLKSAGEQFRTTQDDFIGSLGSVATGLQEKLLQAGIQADDLSGNHLAAVKKELQLIDDQSFKELEQTFVTLGGAADKVFAQLKGNIWMLDSGGAGAKHSLETFQAQYEMLLKTGDKTGATKLLDDKLAREKQILSLQKEMQALGNGKTGMSQAQVDTTYEKDRLALKKVGAGYTNQEIQAEQTLVQILQAQADAQATIAKTGQIKKNTVVQKANTQDLTQEAALQKLAAEGIEKHSEALIKLARTKAETALAATKEGNKGDNVDSQLANQKILIEAEREDSIASAKAQLAEKRAVYRADLAAAADNKTKKKEIEQQWTNDQRASLDAIVLANAEANKAMVTATREAAIEKAKSADAAAQQAADDALNASISGAERRQKIEQEAARNLQALHRRTDAATLAAQVLAVEKETTAEVAGYNARIKALDKYSADYLKKYKELQDKIKQIQQQGDDQVTRLKDTATQKQAMTVIGAENRMRDAIASNIAHSIVMNRSLAQAFRQTGEQMAEQAIKNLIMMELTGDKTKLIAAKTAYHKAFAAMSGIPPAPMWGYAAGAAAFASVMSFETGGKIPGNATGAAGAVPIIGHQGETIITKALTDRVERAEAHGGGMGGGSHSFHYNPTVHAMDADGVDRVLAKHNGVFQRHIAATMRRMHK